MEENLREAVLAAMQRMSSQELRALAGGQASGKQGQTLADLQGTQAALLETVFRQHGLSKVQNGRAVLDEKALNRASSPEPDNQEGEPGLERQDRRAMSDTILDANRPSPPAGSMRALALPTRTSTGTTESDSEKDAAESFVSRKSRQGADMLSKGVPGMQKRDVHSIGDFSERQHKFAKLQHLSTAECDKSGVLGHQHSARLRGAGSPKAYLSTARKSITPQNAEALQHLSNILRKQHNSQAMAELQASPFQDKPATSPLGKATGLYKEDSKPKLIDFRNCLSEGSGHKLLANADAESQLAALAHLHELAKAQKAASKPGYSGPQAPNQLSKQLPPKLLAPLLANPNIANYLAAGGSVSGTNSPFRTVNSNIASDVNFDVNRLLSASYGLAPSASLLSQAQEPQQKMEPAFPEKKPNIASLAPFGSIISNQPESDSPKVLDDSKRKLKGKGTPMGPRPGGGSAEGPTEAAHVVGPDPRILDWVLGYRPSITDRGTEKESFGGRDGPVSAAQAFKDPNSSTRQDQIPTLRRPVALRANAASTTEPVSNPSDGRIEALMAKLHSATMPPSNFSMARGMPKAAQKTPDSNGMNAADIGRVVQWAGQELALRDTKVREAERQRDEERALHDAAMNAVATEVMRIKAGQQELAKTHWNLQDLLAKKTEDLEEKTLIISNMSAAFSEIEQKHSLIVAELKALKEENCVLRQKLGENKIDATSAHEECKMPDEDFQFAQTDVKNRSPTDHERIIIQDKEMPIKKTEDDDDDGPSISL